jgi:hypothetical protein
LASDHEPTKRFLASSVDMLLLMGASCHDVGASDLRIRGAISSLRRFQRPGVRGRNPLGSLHSVDTQHLTMTTLSTPLCSLLGIKHPIILAGMCVRSRTRSSKELSRVAGATSRIRTSPPPSATLADSLAWAAST